MTNVFVIGCPKSGTSLVTSLLDSHPELLVLTEESDIYPIIQPLIDNLFFSMLPHGIKVRIFLRLFLKESHFRNYSTSGKIVDISGNYDYTNFDFKLFLTTLRSRLCALKRFERNRVVKEVFNAVKLVTNTDAEILIEKTPRHTFYVNEIASDFDSPKFIFVERDFTDNFRSYSKKHSVTIEEFSDLWLFNKITYDQLVRKHKVYRVSYEDLVRDPETVMKSLAGFLSINYSNKLLVPTKFGKSWFGNSMFGTKSDTISIDRIGRDGGKLEIPNNLNCLKSSEIFTNEPRHLYKRLLKLIYD